VIFSWLGRLRDEAVEECPAQLRGRNSGDDVNQGGL